MGIRFMDLSLIAFGFGMASVFGLIVGIFSVWNGRMTRREISQLIVEEAKATRELLVKMDEDSKRAREEFQRILLEIQKSAERMEQNQRYIADLVKTEAERIIEKVGSV